MISRDDCHLTVTRELLERYTWDVELNRGLNRLDACLQARGFPPAPYALVKYDHLSRVFHVYPRYDVFYSNADMEGHDILRVARKQVHDGQ